MDPHSVSNTPTESVFTPTETSQRQSVSSKTLEHTIVTDPHTPTSTKADNVAQNNLKNPDAMTVMESIAHTFSKLGQAISNLASKIQTAIMKCFRGDDEAPVETKEEKMKGALNRVAIDISRTYIEGAREHQPTAFFKSKINELKSEGFTDQESVSLLLGALDETTVKGAEERGMAGDIFSKTDWVVELKGEAAKMFPEEGLKNKEATREEIKGIIDQIKQNVTDAMPNASPEEKAKAVASKLTSVLKEIPTKDYPEANRMVSFALGQATLIPTGGVGIEHDLNKTAMRQIQKKGIDEPDKCGGDFWRTMSRLQIFSPGTDEPKINGKEIKSGPEGDALRNKKMNETLNLFYQKITGKTDLLINEESLGNNSTLNDAQALGSKLEQLMKEKGMDEGQIKAMQRTFGLAAQELFTRSGQRAMPESYQKGEVGQLQIGEFSPGAVEQMKPLEYERELSIHFLEEGGCEYQVSQPVTFKDNKTYEPMGFCRIVTTFQFDKNMNCISQSQTVEEANFKK